MNPSDDLWLNRRFSFGYGWGDALTGIGYSRNHQEGRRHKRPSQTERKMAKSRNQRAKMKKHQRKNRKVRH